uniref:Uncharacterized protein n=1 Tax=Romanomermis culicivorax TaxID=13658 RepID=A0A915KX58_ROMCU
MCLYPKYDSLLINSPAEFLGLNRGALNTNVVGCNMNNETATFFYNVKIDRYNKLLQEKVGIEVEFTDHQNKVFPTYPNALISKEYDFDE